MRGSQKLTEPGTRDGVGKRPAQWLRIRHSPLLVMWLFWALIAALRFVSSLTTGMLTFASGMPTLAPALAALIDCFVWGLLTPLIFRLVYRLRFAQRWKRATCAILLLGLVLALAVTMLMHVVRVQLLNHFSGGRGPKLVAAVPSVAAHWWNFWYVSEFVAYMMIVVTALAYYYLVRYHMRGREAARLRAELAHAKLDALRSQLNPHFLFNTLNTTAALIELDPSAARLMLVQLSDLLRETLEGGAPEISLQREMSLVRRYVTIMQTRFADRLQVSEEIEPETLRAMVPQLILQPLVENAIKHGVERLEGMGLIQISSRKDGEGLVLSVTDNGPGAAQIPPRVSTSEGKGLGLSNTKARLRQSYANQQSLTVKRSMGKTIVEIVLPYHQGPVADAGAS